MMSRKDPTSKANLKKDDERLPFHLIVLIFVVLLAMVGAGGAIVYFSFIKPPVSPPSTPVVQHTATVKATAHASPKIHASPTPKPTPAITPTPHVTPTVTGSPVVGTLANPYPPRTGTLVLSDPLKDNSKGNQWDVGTFASGSSCAFSGGSYHVVVSTKGQVFACNAANADFSNFACEVQMTILKGDRGGLFFRQIGIHGPYYYFSIKTDGSYELDSFSGGTSHILKQGTSPSIKKGLNQSNLIAVVAQGNSITLYVNRQSLAQVSDNLINHGHIGLAADPTDQPVEVAFANANVWVL